MWGNVTGCRMWCVHMMARSCSLRAVRGRLYSVATAAKLSTAEVSQRRSELYEREKERQLSLYPRTEKIEVKHVGRTDVGTVFVMNKGLSTPFNCAMHLSEWYCARSVLALVDGELWDMYKPLTKSCSIQFLSFKDENPEEVNKAYWRSCAAVLGHVLEQAFKDDYMVNLVRAPEIPGPSTFLDPDKPQLKKPAATGGESEKNRYINAIQELSYCSNHPGQWMRAEIVYHTGASAAVISGAFCYDVVLDNRLDDWKPTKENLHSFTKDALRLISRDLPFECLEVDEKVAREIFQHNPYKLIMLEEKAAQHPQGKVTLHRFGDFVDLTEGPHVPRTSFCFQYEVTAAHSLPIPSEHVRRFQGLSLPGQLKAHHTVWNKLRTRAQKLVTEKENQEPEPTPAV